MNELLEFKKYCESILNNRLTPLFGWYMSRGKHPAHILIKNGNCDLLFGVIQNDLTPDNSAVLTKEEQSTAREFEEKIMENFTPVISMFEEQTKIKIKQVTVKFFKYNNGHGQDISFTHPEILLDV